MIERMEAIEERIAVVESQYKEMEVAMRGDMRGTPGMLQNLVRIMNDIYTPPDGLRPQMTAIRENIRSKEDQAKGAIWVLRGAWAVIFFSLGMAIKHFWK